MVVLVLIFWGNLILFSTVDRYVYNFRGTELSPEDFSAVREAYEEKGYNMVDAEISRIPDNYTKLTNEYDIKNMTKLLEMLEDNDDVQNVWHNWENEEEWASRECKKAPWAQKEKIIYCKQQGDYVCKFVY